MRLTLVHGQSFIHHEAKMTRIEYNIETGETTKHLVSDEEIAASQAAEAARLAAIPYTEKRAAEYPDFRDYLDGIVKGDQAQIDAYIAACQAVKAKYPKV
jgi:hypothetical protein